MSDNPRGGDAERLSIFFLLRMIDSRDAALREALEDFRRASDQADELQDEVIRLRAENERLKLDSRDLERANIVLAEADGEIAKLRAVVLAARNARTELEYELSTCASTALVLSEFRQYDMTIPSVALDERRERIETVILELDAALAALNAPPYTRSKNNAGRALALATQASENVMAEWELNYPGDHRIMALKVSSDPLYADLKASIIQACFTAINRFEDSNTPPPAPGEGDHA